MNPLIQPLSRLGFLLWNLIWLGLFILLVANLAAVRELDLWIRLVMVGFFGALFLLIAARRLQDAGLHPILAFATLIPIVGYAACLFLLFVPTKKS